MYSTGNYRQYLIITYDRKEKKIYIYIQIDFAGSSVGKESTCNAGDPSSIPGSGRPPEEGIGSPLQYSWASLVAQSVKNLPVMQEIWFNP